MFGFLFECTIITPHFSMWLQVAGACAALVLAAVLLFRRALCRLG